MKITPSKLSGLAGCPCFEYIQHEEGDNEAADEGLKLHHAMETEDLTGLDEEQTDVVQSALTYAQGLVGGHTPDSLRTIMKERKVRIKALDANGIIDWIALFTDGLCQAIDWKFGRLGSEDAEENLQVAAYVLAIFDTFPEVTDIQFHIVNARLKDPTVPFIFTRDMIKDLTAKIQSVVDRVNDPFKKPTAKNPALCTKCANTSRCPAFGATAKVVAEEVAEASALPAVYEAAFLTNPVDRAKAQALANAMETWSMDIKRSNTDFVRQGGEIPGYRMVTRAGKKTIIDTMEAVKRMREVGLLADYDIFATCSLSVPKLSEQLAAVRKVTKVEARDQLLAVLGTFIVTEADVTYLQKGRAVKLPTDG